ncbi:MAG: S8 family serine peptidase [Xanthomonadales bacterium]|nr:S8 family serine peptidase [Xanthomonadales bacterium]
MRNPVRLNTLAVLVAASLGGGLATPVAWSQVTVSDAPTASPAASEHALYMIYFGEPGALEYRGGVGNLEGTAGATDGSTRFDANSAASRAYREHLEQVQAQYVAGLRERLGRQVEVPHTFQITHSGISARLTEAEAAAAATLPGVVRIERDREYPVDTFRGPSFIGAQTIWGAAVPTPATATNFGKGIVVGVIDSGVLATHPSFANDARCGFSVADPKLRSTRDCSTSAGGVCTGPNGATDASGHGSHTASTSAGNVVNGTAVPAPTIPAPYSQISGVAPCASLRTYRVCESSTCSGAAIAAGMANVLTDGDVDVVNYSISGGTSPWSSGDGDRNFLEFVNADIFVSASAGNTRAETPDPVGNVNHIGPWVMSVASATHDENPSGGSISAAGPGTPPANTQNIALNIAGVNVGTAGVYPIRYNAANDIGCTATGGFPANFFTGAIALIPRGTCSFEEKLNNAAAQGAVAGIIYNNAAGALNMAIGTATLPSYSILQADGLALRAFIDANGATPTTANFTPATKIGDLLSSFSLRGPTRAIAADITKPDIVGPGDNIYAAYNVTPFYAYLGGTSMSSPHVAGSGALVRAMRPTWSPMAVKSALQMTAKSNGVKEDGVSPWNIDDVGSGRVQVDKAIAAGLVMEETYARFLAANPSGGSINMKELNIPSMRNMNCVPNCTFTRTFTSKLAASATWNITSQSDYGVNVTASPSNFTIAAGGTQAVTFTIALADYGPGTQLPNTPAFANVILTPTVPSASPVEHLTVAVRGTRDGIFKDGFDPAVVVNPNHVTFELNHLVHDSLNGTCIKWLTGVVRDNLASCTGDDFNPYTVTGTPRLLSFYWLYTGATANRGGSASGSAYVVAAPGTEIGPSTTFIDTAGSTPTSAWRVAGGLDGYLGFRFLNTTTSAINYGYVRINNVGAVGTSGMPATVVSYTFDNSGAPITVPTP